MTLDLKYLERKLDKALKIDNMKHTIKNINGQPMCQAVNPYRFEPHEADNVTDSEFYERRLRYKEFHIANPPYHFIHPDHIPDNSIIDGQDLTEPFLQILDNGQWFTETEHPLYDNDSETRMAVAFKHPEMMACIDGVFIRKEQIKSPRLEKRRKEISQEVKDRVDCYTPYQELFEYMSNEHNVILQMGDIHEIISIVIRIEQIHKESLDPKKTLLECKNRVAKLYGYSSFQEIKNKFQKEPHCVSDLVAFIDQSNKKYYTQINPKT